MEVEKPFKCSVCSSRFTNEDHLQVHRKRHEMSLNLSKPGLSNTNNPADGFVDETPTPTRFIRNCEEVGLFQDLQNVNPFDEQFTKAASATPSSENYEFNFSVSMLKKSSYDDTLNTPQVFGYAVSSASSTVPTISEPVIQNPGISTTSASSSLSRPIIPTTTENLDLDKDVVVINTISSSSSSSTSSCASSKTMAIACTAEEVKVESTTPDNESFIPPIFSLKQTVDLSSSSSNDDFMSQTTVVIEPENITQVPRSIVADGTIEEDESEIYSTDRPKPEKISRKEIIIPQDSKKAEMLERNRAAASRSRERRKQWVSGLEARCQTLQALLSTAQCETAKLRAENNFLREELGKHSSCDVTRAEPRQRVTVTVPRTPEFQPQILKHSSQSLSASSQKTSPAVTPVTLSSPTPTTASALLKSSTSVTVPPPSIPIIQVKPKRGRPRKGCEKRIGGICIPTQSSKSVTPASGPSEMPMKVEILPVKSVDGKAITNVIILKPTV